MGSKVTLIHKTPNTVIIKTSGVGGGGGAATWGGISGTITNQTDLVNYIDAEIGAIPPPVIPTPPTPTLQSVTDEGNTTTNEIKTDAGFEAYRVGARRVFLGGTSINGQLLLDSGGTWDVNLTGGSNKYFAQGNFGIGTTAPDSKLTVAQSEDDLGLKITGFDDEDNSNLHLFVDRFGNNKIESSEFLQINSGGSSRYRTVGYLRLEVGGVSNQLQLDYNYMKFSSGGTETMRITPGKVGIGTTSPSALLEIASNSTNDFIKLTTTGGGATPVKLIFEKTSLEQGVIEFNRNGDFEIYNTDNDGGVLISGSGSANADVYVNHAGNVGIGTTAPSEKLHVVGNAKVEGDIKMNDSMNRYIRGFGNSYIKLYDNLTGGIDIYNLNGTATTRIFGGLSVTGNFSTGGAFSMNGDLTIGNDKKIYGVFGSNSIKLYNGPDASMIFQIKHPTVGAYIWLDKDSNNLMLLNRDGKLGIGNTAPDEKLRVDGNIKSAGDFIGSAVRLGFAGTANITTYDTNEDLLINPNGSGDILMQTTSGNVGIGTTAPSRNLHIHANTGSSYLQLTQASTGITDNDGFQIAMGVAQVNFINRENGNMVFETNNTEKLRITSSGFVGIGTTAPSAKLDVNGDISVPLGSNIRWSTQLGIRKDSNGELNFFAGTNSTNGGFNFRRWNGSAYESGTLVIRNNGNVGIGTTTPLYKLEVVGDARIDGGPFIIRGTNSFTTSSDTSGVLFNLGSGIRGFRFQNTNGELIRIDASGNVGIGTTAPSEKLEVAGNIKISGNDQFIYGPSNTEYIRFYTPQNSIILRAANYIRFGANIMLDGADKSILNNNGDAYLTYYNQSYDGFDKIIRNYVPIVKEYSTEPAIISRADLEFRIDSNNDSTTSAFKITKDAGTELMRVNEGGNVGIGTTAPIAKLDVKGHIRLGVGHRFQIWNDNVGMYRDSNDLRLAGYTGIQFFSSATSMTAQTERMRIDGSTGNVGIGTTAPDSKLHVKATSGIAFKVDPNSADKEWYIDTTNPDHLKKEGNLILNADPTNVHASTKISFNIDGSNKASINSDGDLGVGTTAQTSKVHIDGTAMRQLRIGTAGGPSSNTDTSGAEGDIAYDDLYLYIKTGSGWGRIALDFAF